MASIPATIPDADQWTTEVQRALDRIFALPDNWDGCGSPAITPAARETTRHLVRQIAAFLVPVPELVATPGGGLQWKWRLSGRKLELEVRPSGQVVYFAVTADREHEGPLSSTDELRHLLRELFSPSDWIEGTPDEDEENLQFRTLSLSANANPHRKPDGFPPGSDMVLRTAEG